jgi:hypothetical protein
MLLDYPGFVWLLCPQNVTRVECAPVASIVPVDDVLERYEEGHRYRLASISWKILRTVLPERTSASNSRGTRPSIRRRQRSENTRRAA